MSETRHALDRERSSVCMWYRHAVSRYLPATGGTSGAFFIFSRVRIQHSVRVSIVAMEQSDDTRLPGRNPFGADPVDARACLARLADAF